MIKILTVPTSSSVADIETALKAEGIKENRLSGALGASYLPKSGKFEAYGVDGDFEEKDDKGTVTKQGTRHIRIGTANMLDSISLSRLQRDFFVGVESSDEKQLKSKLLLSQSNRYYLPANTVINPALKGNSALIIQKMIGKWFVATEIQGVETAFKEGGYTSVDDVRFVPRKSYKIELFKNETEQKTYLAALESKEVK